LKKAYNAGVAEDLEDISLVYPDNGDFSLFIMNIEEICKMNGFEVMSIGFVEPEGEELDISLSAATPWNVNVAVEGDKGDLISLLADFESMPSFTQIEGVAFSTPEEGKSSYLFNVTLRVYKIASSDFY